MAPFELLLLSALVASSIALPTTPSRRQDQHALTHTSRPVTSDYQCFDGTASTNSISASNWLSFDQLWHINEPTILSNNGGDTYIEHYIREVILQVSREDDVDARLMLAVMMQESSGRASIPCKSQRDRTSKCGLLQVSGGSSFDAAKPEASILQMVRDGVGVDYFDQAPNGDRFLTDVTNRLLGWNGRGDRFKTCGAL